MLNKITNLILKRPMIILLASLLIFAILLAGVMKIEMATGNDTLIEPSTQEYLDNYNYQEEFGSDPIIVIYKGESVQDLFTVENLTGLKTLQTQLLNYEEVFVVNSPAVLFPVIPAQQAMLDASIYDEFGNLKTMFSEFVIDDQYMRIAIVLKGEVPDTIVIEIIDTINIFLEEEGLTDTTLVSGKPVLDLSIKTSMTSSMQQMMALSALLMIIILFIVFRVRWRLLPLSLILIAVIATIGIMGWLNIGITMVSMAAFPILIGLGIDYSIQFQSRYAEEILGGESNE
jgi:predicted RND superfamily exporter protein